MTGREYHPFTYYGDPDAEQVVMAMGSITETLKETVDYLNAQGRKVGMIDRTSVPPVQRQVFLQCAAQVSEADCCPGPDKGTGCQWRAPLPGCT